MLGIRARDGKDQPVDRKAALYHFQIAVLQGGDEAKRLLTYDLNHLSTELEAKEVAELTSAAGMWYSQHRSSQTLFRNGNANKYFPEPLSTDTVRASVPKGGQPTS